MNQFMNPYLNAFGMNGYGQASTVMPQPNPLASQMQFANQQVTRVNGRNGASQYQMGANSSALLLDESGTMVWLATTDGAGYKTVQAYDIAPHKDEPAPDYGDLESRVKTIEKRLEEIVNVNTKRTASTGKKQSEDGAD